ncbi:MAG: hypothetical protein AAGJ08_20235 [Cyanobacteria bacterium P01_H01_bin.35]
MIIRDDLKVDFWQQIGKYKARIARISLADCFALTLADREGGILVISDRKEFQPIIPLNPHSARQNVVRKHGKT